MNDNEVIARIAEAGVAFNLTEEIEEHFRRAGLSERVIAAARTHQRTAAAWDADQRLIGTGLPFAADEILRELRRGTSPDHLTAAVDRRGVAFRLEPELADRIELAGGTLSLLGMITMRQTRAADCAAAPKGDARVPARLVRSTPVDIPEAAKREKAEGLVRVRAVVVPDGSVAYAHAVKGHELLARAAEQAVRTWVYEPAREAGRPVTSIVEVEVHFLRAR